MDTKIFIELLQHKSRVTMIAIQKSHILRENVRVLLRKRCISVAQRKFLIVAWKLKYLQK